MDFSSLLCTFVAEASLLHAYRLSPSTPCPHRRFSRRHSSMTAYYHYYDFFPLILIFIFSLSFSLFLSLLPAPPPTLLARVDLLCVRTNPKTFRPLLTNALPCLLDGHARRSLYPFWYVFWIKALFLYTSSLSLTICLYFLLLHWLSLFFFSLFPC